jgi:nicotinate-nucleotide adenylyltransferase
MEKIGIYGGTFNPIHNGHLNMAKQMGNMLELDRILIIPANVPPHKVGVPITEEKHRYEMCRLACEESRLFQVCDIELKREGRSYTVDTLNEISSKYNNSRLYFMVGSDSFLSVIKWVGFEKIIRLATLCTAPRNTKEIPQLLKMEQLLRSKGAITRICDIPIMPISSTEIRNRISKGLNVEEVLPQKIVDYIKKNGLYMKNKGVL